MAAVKRHTLVRWFHTAAIPTTIVQKCFFYRYITDAEPEPTVLVEGYLQLTRCCLRNGMQDAKANSKRGGCLVKVSCNALADYPAGNKVTYWRVDRFSVAL